MDEMLGVGFAPESAANRRETYRRDPAMQGNHAPQAPHSQASLKENVDKTKTNNESIIDGLKKENDSLKKSLKEYSDSFVVLRKQINEVQIFNAKLAYVNKLFSNGGLTMDEKSKIAEQFDKVVSIEDAKKLYTKLINESNTISKQDNVEDKIKSVKTTSVLTNETQASKSNTLYESYEIKRMKELAGIKK